MPFLEFKIRKKISRKNKPKKKKKKNKLLFKIFLMNLENLDLFIIKRLKKKIINNKVINDFVFIFIK
jgi:hypothetical protein